MRSAIPMSILVLCALVAVMICPTAGGRGHDGGRAGVPVQVAGYVGTAWGVALGVETGGRVHVLWTGKRPTDVDFTAFYANSADDGATWSALQLLDTGNAFDPQIVVDDPRQIVNLGVDINFNNRHKYFLAADGAPHLVLGASQYLDIGVFYQRLDPPPGPPQIFVDGFESGGTSAWAAVAP